MLYIRICWPPAITVLTTETPPVRDCQMWVLLVFAMTCPSYRSNSASLIDLHWKVHATSNNLNRQLILPRFAAVMETSYRPFAAKSTEPVTLSDLRSNDNLFQSRRYLQIRAKTSNIAIPAKVAVLQSANRKHPRDHQHTKYPCGQQQVEHQPRQPFNRTLVPMPKTPNSYIPKMVRLCYPS